MEFDGRDELITKHYGQQSMVAKAPSLDEQIKQYSDPWGMAYYSRFDDNGPGSPVLYDNCVEGVMGLKMWIVPVTGVQKMLDAGVGGYEQVKMGMLEITETPNGDGTSEVVMSIRDYAST